MSAVNPPTRTTAASTIRIGVCQWIVGFQRPKELVDFGGREIVSLFRADSAGSSTSF